MISRQRTDNKCEFDSFYHGLFDIDGVSDPNIFY